MGSANLKHFMFAFMLGSNLALAETAKVSITAPEDGAMVDSRHKTAVKYEADAGTDGDHLHLYLDGKRLDVLRQLKGVTMVEIPPGKHQICMEINTKGHVPVGAKECIKVTSQ